MRAICRSHIARRVCPAFALNVLYPCDPIWEHFEGKLCVGMNILKISKIGNQIKLLGNTIKLKLCTNWKWNAIWRGIFRTKTSNISKRSINLKYCNLGENYKKQFLQDYDFPIFIITPQSRRHNHRCRHDNIANVGHNHFRNTGKFGLRNRNRWHCDSGQRWHRPGIRIVSGCYCEIRLDSTGVFGLLLCDVVHHRCWMRGRSAGVLDDIRAGLVRQAEQAEAYRLYGISWIPDRSDLCDAGRSKELYLVGVIFCFAFMYF